MSLFGFKEKKDIERLRATLSPEQVELADLQGALEQARQALAAVTAQREQEVQKLDVLRAQLVQTEEELNLQSFGVYKPRYDLMRADEYRARLLEIRAQQKEMIKAKTAVTGLTNWTVNNNAAQGRKMVSDRSCFCVPSTPSVMTSSSMCATATWRPARSASPAPGTPSPSWAPSWASPSPPATTG